ncbi:hypothetical protein RMCBS344292_13101 [Rhizopus microsporus]|nr:hypothetical protein RMCBS344292_13101 [Rhizopus microsporus]
MSEIVLSNTEYDYTNGSMIVDIDPGLKNDSSNNNNSTANNNTVPTTSFEEAYSSYPGYPPNYPMTRLGYFQDKVQPTSPESSISSTSSPTPSPSPPNQLSHFTSQQPILTTTTASANNDLLTPLDSTRFSNSTTARIHIQSEQKRRAQIKDGFDELRKHLPGCNNKKMSKAALLTRTVQQLQHLKNMQTELLSEVERLIQENESLKK